MNRDGLVMNKRLYKNKKLANFPRQSGFTLLEVMISLSIITAMVIIFAGTLHSSAQSGRLNGQYAQATSLCQHKVDQLRAIGFGRLNYTEMKNAGIIDSTPATSPYTFMVTDEVGTYLPAASTSIQVAAINTTVTQVTITISWKKVLFENKISSVTLTALICNTE